MYVVMPQMKDPTTIIKIVVRKAERNKKKRRQNNELGSPLILQYLHQFLSNNDEIRYRSSSNKRQTLRG